MSESRASRSLLDYISDDRKPQKVNLKKLIDRFTNFRNSYQFKSLSDKDKLKILKRFEKVIETEKDKLRQEEILSNGKIDESNELNELRGNEWLFFTKSVLRSSYPSKYGHKLRKQHGANKPPQLMKHIIEFFTKSRQTVLDPFAGVGGTLLGASLCNRIATGIEINKKWIDIYREVCKLSECVKVGIREQEMINGDCLEELDKMIEKERQFDFVATDPPYSIALEKTMCTDEYKIQHRKTDFNNFSDDERDFRNFKTFNEYYEGIRKMAEKVYQILKDKKYFVVIIRDSYQDTKYIMASYEISERIKQAGFTMKGIKIWYGTGARVRPYGYPYVYVPNIIHQNILIFRKEN
ncbi:MAG: DNA methyltransferase [Candidatus Methanofastidiosia archaeon]